MNDVTAAESPTNLDPTNLEFDDDTIDMRVDEDVRLTGTLTDTSDPENPEILPDKEIRWYVDDDYKETTTTYSDGRLGFDFEPDETGVFTVKAVFEGTEDLEAAEASATVNVSIGTDLDLDDSTAKAGEDIILTSELTDDNEQPIAGKLIKFYRHLENDDYSLLGGTYTNNAGIARFITTARDKAGTFENYFKAVFEGTDEYEAADAFADLTIEKLGPNINLEDANVTVNDEVTLKATLTDEEGNPLPGKTIEFSREDNDTWKSIGSVETDENGLAEYSYNPDEVGTFNIKAEFAGTDEYESATATATLTVEKRGTTLDLQNASVEEAGDEVTLVATLTDDDDQALANRRIDFYVNNEPVGFTTTDANGVARLLTDAPDEVGVFPIEAVFAGTAKYKMAEDTATLTVGDPVIGTTLDLNDAETIVNEVVALIATLTDDNNNPVSNVPVDFYVNNENVGFTTTDANGVAQFLFEPEEAGVFPIEADFAGTAEYGASNDTATLTVEDEPVPETGIYSADEIEAAAIWVRNYVTANSSLPSAVTMTDTAGVEHEVSMPVFLELSTAYLIQQDVEFEAIEVASATSPSGPRINRSLSEAGYMDMATRVNTFIRANNRAPNFAGSLVGNIRYEALVDTFARVVAFQAENNRMPRFVTVNTGRVV